MPNKATSQQLDVTSDLSISWVFAKRGDEGIAESHGLRLLVKLSWSKISVKLVDLFAIVDQVPLKRTIIERLSEVHRINATVS